MISKTFEIRDAGTFIPILAVKLNPECAEDRYLLSRAGYGSSPEEQSEYVMLIQLSGGGGKCHTDPYEWGPGTYHLAQKYLSEKFDELKSGEVIDVEFIYGRTNKPKKSESELG